jgi:hypothetical protein
LKAHAALHILALSSNHLVLVNALFDGTAVTSSGSRFRMILDAAIPGRNVCVLGVGGAVGIACVLGVGGAVGIAYPLQSCLVTRPSSVHLHLDI